MHGEHSSIGRLAIQAHPAQHVDARGGGARRKVNTAQQQRDKISGEARSCKLHVAADLRREYPRDFLRPREAVIEDAARRFLRRQPKAQAAFRRSEAGCVVASCWLRRGPPDTCSDAQARQFRAPRRRLLMRNARVNSFKPFELR